MVILNELMIIEFMVAVVMLITAYNLFISMKLLKKERRIMATLSELEVQVAKNTEVDASAIVLIKGIAQQLIDLKNDPAKIQALADSLKTSADALAAAIVENTPAA